MRLAPTAQVRLAFPGGGGYGDPHERPVERCSTTWSNGYVGDRRPRARLYGVEVAYVGDPDAVVRPPGSYRVDEERTAQLRGDVTAAG